MAWRPYENAEPIKGYTLIQKLGTGGYGEVWKATAPGGLTKAVKIIYGNLTEARAEQEFRALSRIKEVRYPFLLSLERIETIEDTLLIVTELADESLLDRFEQSRRAGKPGIPRDELLGYLRDCADALDYMNDKYGLQHLDIKPQNLLLVGGRVKIADFGLVKDLEGTSVTATGGVTPIYAPPEAFDNKVSRFSDQYSLAIVYQEMLTGIRPFPGKTYLQLLNQHVNSPPMLDPLPPGDRPIIGRGLAKVADERFPTCREMVNELLRAPANVPPAAATVGPSPVPATDKAEDSLFHTSPPSTPENSAAEDFLGSDTLVNLAQSPAPLAGTEERAPAAPLMCLFPQAERVRLRSTLFLGVGGLATFAIRNLRQRLYARIGDLSRVPVFNTLLLDTDRATLRLGLQGKPGEALTPNETLLLPLHRPEYYRPQSKKILRWLDRRWLYGIPRSQLTEGMRPLGRLALIGNLDNLLDTLRTALRAMTSAEARAATTAATGMAIHEGPPRVFVVASISGGTGGGMILDLAYALRQALNEQRLSTEGLCAILMHATPTKPAESELARMNAYAALIELNHFSRHDIPYPGDPEHGLSPLRAQGSPFQDCYLVHLGDGLDQTAADAATDAVAEYLFLNTVSPAAEFFDQYRQSTNTAPYAPGAELSLRSFGMHRLHFPRHALADLTAGLFCKYLLTRWRNGDARVPEAAIKADALRRAAELNLQAESLAERFHLTARDFWKEDPEATFAKLVADGTAKNQAVAPEAVQESLRKIEEILGAGGDVAYGQERERTPLESAIAVQAGNLGISAAGELLEWLIEIVDDPRGRLKAALAAADHLMQHISVMTQSARYLVNQYRINRDHLRERLQSGDFESAGGGWLSVGRRPPENTTAKHLLLEICRIRLKEIIVENTLEVLRAVSPRLAKFSQDIMLAREKLEHFADQFQTPDASAVTPIDADRYPATTRFLPGKSKTLVEAAAALFKRLEPELTLPFEEEFRSKVLSKHGGLWRLVSRVANLSEVLQADLQSRARAAMLDAITETDAAQLFLETRKEQDDAPVALAGYLEDAAPKLSAAAGWQHLVLCVPAGRAGDAVAKAIGREASDMPTTTLSSDGDIVLCREAAHYAIGQVAAALVGNDLALTDLAAKVMTRVDVSWAAMPMVS